MQKQESLSPKERHTFTMDGEVQCWQLHYMGLLLFTADTGTGNQDISYHINHIQLDIPFYFYTKSASLCWTAKDEEKFHLPVQK